MSGKTGRPRGAQPGNLNAVKHGFYSEQFRPNESMDLEARMAAGLEDEIAMVRVVTRRILAMADGVICLEDGINALGALGLAATRLAALLRVQHLLGGDHENETSQAISEALTDALKDWKLS